MAEAAEVQEQSSPEEEDKQGRIQQFGLAFATERKKYIDARAAAGVETRWREDLEFYHGKDTAAKETTDMMQRLAVHGEAATSRTQPEAATRSRIFVNITRPKTNAAEARIADMLLPVDEKNWGIKPTPVPALSDMAKDKTEIPDAVMRSEDGTERPATVGDVAREEMSKAVDRGKKMQDEIDDQLTEFDYNAECRDVVRWASRLGTGIIKGPVVVNEMRKSWSPMQKGDNSTIHVLNLVEEKRPHSYSVSPWDFFPDMSCGNDIRNAEATWERKRVTARELRQLARSPGYLPDQIRAVLAEGPQKSYAVQNHPSETEGQSQSAEDDTRFELWERHGDVEKKMLEECGSTVPKRDELENISGCVVMVNQRVIKAYVHPLDTEDLIYDVFQWEPDEYTVFGYGVPYLLRQASQRMLNAAARQMMDHGGVSSGPQIVCRSNAIEPVDGKWEITGRKLWKLNDDGARVQDVFGVTEISSHINDYIAIIELAMKFADEEVALPMIMAGERGSAPEQVGSMTMLMNAATTVLRRLVKRFDDRVTKRHIRRYYDWNMQYNPKAEIKGDFEVDARGSTALMQRDLQNQALVKWVSALGNPVIGYMFDKLRFLKKALQADYIVPDDVLKTDDQIKDIEDKMAKSPPQPSPDVLVKAETDVKVAQIREEGATAREFLKMGDEDKARQHEMMVQAIDSEMGLRDMLNKRGINLDTIKASLTDTAMKIRLDKEAMMREPSPKVVAVT